MCIEASHEGRIDVTNQIRVDFRIDFLMNAFNLRSKFCAQILQITTN